MKPRVITIKHYVPNPIDTVIAAAIENIVFINAVANPTSAIDVSEGSTISAVWVELWVLADAQNVGSTIITLEKKPANAPNMTTVNAANLFAYNNKKNILYTTQGLTSEQNANAVPIIRQWFKIPKGKQRFGLGDQMVLNISAAQEGVENCGMFIFKEQK